MNIAYFGSPSISASLFEALVNNPPNGLNIVCVFTQPDRPAGKRLEMTKTKVKEAANRQNVPVFDLDIRSDEDGAVEILKKYGVDMAIVFAYGAMIGAKLLNIPKYGFWNVHPSLLPTFRGPSPIIYPIILGYKNTGVSIIKINDKLDAGPIIKQNELIINPSMMRDQLENELTQLASKMIRELFSKDINQDMQLQLQKNDDATYTRLLNKDDGFVSIDFLKMAINDEMINLNNLPQILKEYYGKYPYGHSDKQYNAREVLYNLYLGLSPWPGVWTKISIKNVEKRLKLLKFNNDHAIDLVQLEGKRPVNFAIFSQAYNIFS